MGVHGHRLTALAAAFAVGAIPAAAASRRAFGLSELRICNGAYLAGDACQVDRRAKLEPSEALHCSVRARASRATPATARLLYEGGLQRSSRTVVYGSRILSIGASFPQLALPAGRFTCVFTLGPATVRVDAVEPGSRETAFDLRACQTSTTLGHACQLDQTRGAFPATHSVTCSAMVARRRGQRVEIDVVRLGRRASTTLYAAKDALAYPIASVWARASAASGRNLAAGRYSCRFWVAGSLVGGKRFTILR